MIIVIRMMVIRTKIFRNAIKIMWKTRIRYDWCSRMKASVIRYEYNRKETVYSSSNLRIGNILKTEGSSHLSRRSGSQWSRREAKQKQISKI